MKKYIESIKLIATCAAIMAAALSIPVGIWAIRSKFEASAYNRVTNSNVSTWDAMWIELRVNTPAK